MVGDSRKSQAIRVAPKRKAVQETLKSTKKYRGEKKLPTGTATCPQLAASRGAREVRQGLLAEPLGLKVKPRVKLNYSPGQTAG